METINKAAGNGRANGKWHPIASAVVGAILGSGGSIGIIFSTPLGQELARPDPYTSTQAQAEHKQVEVRLQSLEFHVRNHPDQTNKFDRRITTLEANQETIIRNQGRIINKLDRK